MVDPGVCLSWASPAAVVSEKRESSDFLADLMFSNFSVFLFREGNYLSE
jgi:hypothetical protein